MTGKGRVAVMNAPSPVSEKQMRELGLTLRKEKK